MIEEHPSLSWRHEMRACNTDNGIKWGFSICKFDGFCSFKRTWNVKKDIYTLSFKRCQRAAKRLKRHPSLKERLILLQLGVLWSFAASFPDFINLFRLCQSALYGLFWIIRRIEGTQALDSKPPFFAVIF